MRALSVGQAIRTPGPVFGSEISELLHKPIREYLAHLSHAAVPAVATKVSMNTDDSESDSTWMGEMFGGVQGTMEQIDRKHLLTFFPT